MTFCTDVLADGATVDLSQVGPILDDMADAVTEVRIVGTAEEELSGAERQTASSASSAGIKLSLKEAGVSVSAKTTEEAQVEGAYRRKVAGTQVHRVNFGRVGDVFSRLSHAIGDARLWVILDEWSVVPLNLQPYLADLLRRSLFPVPNITVKIGAIEKRSRFQLTLEGREYLGIELGGDASADLNMDDFMVFDNDEEQAVSFFSNMVFRHFRTTVDDRVEEMPTSPHELIRATFTQENVFRELVRAAEGIPRDALYVLSLAAQADFGRPISMETIRKASKTWYQRDKETAVSANPRALALLHWIVDKVIAHRRARAFLLQRNVTSELIDSLFDARVLHLLKRNISAHDRPGVRYDVYKIDYGCYVDLLLTIRAPLGLLSDDSGLYVDVPPDDYRAIRRAILDIDEFERVEANQ